MSAFTSHADDYSPALQPDAGDMRAMAARQGRRVPEAIETRELTLIAILAAAYLFTFADSVAQEFYVMNVAGPVALIGIMLVGAWRHIGRDALALWQPFFWFRIGCAVFYGVGALAPFIANDATVAVMRSLFQFTDESMLKIGVINAVCILVIMLTAVLLERLRGERFETVPGHGASDRTDDGATMLFALLFLLVGGFARYVIVLPVALGLIDLVPGILGPIGKSYLVGLFLLILMGLRGDRRCLVAACVLVPLDLAVGLLTFAKVEVLLTLIFSFLGVLHHRLTIARMIVGLIVVVGIYSQLDPIIHVGRDELWRRYLALSAPLQERLEIMRDFTGTEWQGTERAENQSALSRLSYVNAASMVVSWHDAGRPGESLANVAVVLIPRFLWPDKPIITATGTDLYQEATGQVGSSITPGLFAEAYWNLGWFGIPLLMVPFALLLDVLSRYARGVMGREAWIHLPAILLGVQFGAFVDTTFVAGVIGGGATALAYALLASWIEPLLSRNRGRQRA